MSSEISYMPATEMAQAIRARRLSSVEVTEHFFQRIGRLDPQLNSYLALCHEQALADARSLFNLSRVKTWLLDRGLEWADANQGARETQRQRTVLQAAAVGPAT